ncbi:uncharacterized protein LOC142355784 [Convolutriloba macropyga]|uniref:uncharacterized protein LOC142355784 n=1 Tax=Convolutriloba macropyga TaxID=536237 RepID=UPI003F51FA83
MIYQGVRRVTQYGLLLQTSSKSVEGDTIDDINECDFDDPICGNNSQCNNTIGSYFCTCDIGYYSPDSTHHDCTDVEECLDDYGNESDICGDFSNCTNTIGSYFCTCLIGFKSPLGTDHDCTDIEECVEVVPFICGDDSNCTNTVGTYSCQCNLGYKSPNLTHHDCTG